MLSQKSESKQVGLQSAFRSVTPADLFLTVRLFLTEKSYLIVRKQIHTKKPVIDFDKAVKSSQKDSSLFQLNYVYLSSFLGLRLTS